MLAMIEEVNHQSSTTIELSIEIQLSNQAIQALSKATQIRSRDQPKDLDPLRGHKFMDHIFKDSHILRKYQLVPTQDLDQLPLPVRYKSQCNKNILDSLSNQSIKDC